MSKGDDIMIVPYKPGGLPPTDIDWIKLITLIGQANAELARYDGVLQGILNPKVLLSPMMTNEAVISSKIEGTQATLEEVLEYEALPEKMDVNDKKYHDIKEILNYRDAMFHCTNWLKKKPVTLNLIKEIHYILLDSVRGQDKSRGMFRMVQNWIGKPGDTIEQASYVPPEPHHLMGFLSNLEIYFHNEEKDRLVQLAIIHAQFEMIHPFVDGNGRVGRILIPIFLFEKGLLHSPNLYISGYFDANRDEYFRRLSDISKDGRWNEWIEYFLKAVIEQSKNNCSKAKSILELYEVKKEKIASVTRSHYAIRIVDTLFKKPIFNTTDFTKASKIPKASSIRLLKILKDNKIISTLRKSDGRTPEIMSFDKLLDIVA